MTLDELKQYCSSEFQNIDRILDELSAVYETDKTAYTMAEQAAMATFLINMYGGIENILKQMLLYDKLDVGDSPGWHEKVLRKSGEIGILPPDLFHMLGRYLSFRHFFIYNYFFNINWEDMKALVETMKDIASKIRAETDEYLQTI